LRQARSQRPRRQSTENLQLSGRPQHPREGLLHLRLLLANPAIFARMQKEAWLYSRRLQSPRAVNFHRGADLQRAARFDWSVGFCGCSDDLKSLSRTRPFAAAQTDTTRGVVSTAPPIINQRYATPKPAIVQSPEPAISWYALIHVLNMTFSSPCAKSQGRPAKPRVAGSGRATAEPYPPRRLKPRPGPIEACRSPVSCRTRTRAPIAERTQDAKKRKRPFRTVVARETTTKLRSLLSLARTPLL
jgi:hypothetical protein